MFPLFPPHLVYLLFDLPLVYLDQFLGRVHHLLLLFYSGNNLALNIESAWESNPTEKII
jgi:hypothetical protein